MKQSALVAAVAAATLATGAQAHFQLLYTPEVMLEKPAEIPLALVFGHPMENGHTMDMGKPEEFFVLFKGDKTDLTDTLTAVEWQGTGDHTADAYTATYKVRRNGDYIFTLVPAPYLETAEDIYIQQITKSYVNKGGMPTGWNEPLGLATEIVPLNKPYQVFAGGTFTGQLLSEGKPAAGVECEIEYINTDIDLEDNAFGKDTNTPPPATAIVAITDDNGMFTFGIPTPGVWGFACLGSGPVKEHEGKELSQDAVIWINAEHLGVDAETEEAGESAASTPAPASPETVAPATATDFSPADVRMVQVALYAQGYNPGPRDGQIGGQTMQAIKSFQQDNGLTASGLLDDELAKRLGIR